MRRGLDKCFPVCYNAIMDEKTPEGLGREAYMRETDTNEHETPNAGQARVPKPHIDKKMRVFLICFAAVYAVVFTAVLVWRFVHIHDKVVIEAVPPTCISTGLTEGKYCAECGEILVKQEIVPVTAHEYDEWIIEKEPDFGIEGSKYATCSVCGYVCEEVIEMLFSSGLNFTSHDDGTCSVSGIGTCTDLDVYIPTTSPQGDKVYYIGDGAFQHCTDLTSIVIPDSVMSIGNSAFHNCTGLTSIVIPDSVTSIGNDAFSWCESLTSIVIPDGVTSIGEAAFALCSGLTSIVIPDSVTSIGNSAFDNCSGLVSIDIPDSVTSIGDYTFIRCHNLISITIPNSVTSLGEMTFCYCYSLTSLIIPDNVMSIGVGAFSGCQNLTELTVAKGNSAFHSEGNCLIETESKTLIAGCMDSVIPTDGSVTSIGDYAFSSCDRLTSIAIPDSVTSIGEWAFDSCDRLTSIEIPDGVTNIGDYAFYYCDRLTSIKIPAGVTSIGKSVFSGCSSVGEIVIAEGNPIYHSDGNCLIETGSKTLIAGCMNSVIPSDGSVTSIGDGAFSGCSMLTPIAIPDSVTSIGDSAFSGCSKLTSIAIPDSVTSIGEWAFHSCDRLTDIYFTGTESEWEAITKGTDWDSFTGNYTIHYNYVPS